MGGRLAQEEIGEAGKHRGTIETQGDGSLVSVAFKAIPIHILPAILFITSPRFSFPTFSSKCK
jgi:hypothetical protein